MTNHFFHADIFQQKQRDVLNRLPDSLKLEESFAKKRFVHKKHLKLFNPANFNSITAILKYTIYLILKLSHHDLRMQHLPKASLRRRRVC